MINTIISIYHTDIFFNSKIFIKIQCILRFHNQLIQADS
jgi:hypothetical protein